MKLVDSVAYVPQQAWIQNATVRNNILFGKGYSSQQYDEIVSQMLMVHGVLFHLDYLLTAHTVTDGTG